MAKLSMKERLLEKQRKLREKRGGLWRTIKEGTLRARPLPIKEGQEFSFEVFIIWANKDIMFISPSSIGEKCAWKEKYDELMASSDEAERKFAKSKMYMRKKSLMPHLFYSDPKGKIEDGTGLLLLSPNQTAELIDLWMDDEAGDFTDPIHGYDIKYKRVGSGKMDTEYTQSRCNPTKLPKEHREPIDLEKMIRDMIPSYKQTKKYVEQFLALGMETDEDEDETRSSKKKDKKKKKKSRDL